MNRHTVVLAFFAFFGLVASDFGSCRYDTDRCSCKIGEANQGTCWDSIIGQPGQCSKRFCRAGWTCACGGRTHVCFRQNKSANALKNEADASKDIAECVTKSIPMVSSQEITLGFLRFHFSRKGVLANDCIQVAWWHNGELLGNRKLGIPIDSSTLNDAVSERENHSQLELRPGDIIAFRFRGASYYCYNHLTDITANTTSFKSTDAGVTTHYAREFSTDWFMPSFKLDSNTLGDDESETDLKKFLPLRTKKLSSDTAIVPGDDMWEPRDDSNQDNKRSNWYYRIQIPNPLPGTA